MEFVHSYHQKGDTIAAIATPPGEGGVAIVRISGEKALEVADKIFSGPVLQYKSHTVHFGTIRDPSGEIIDEALVIPMHAPRSYTGEMTVEVQCHGGSLIAGRVLECALRAGARLALPGEFTQRAFLNGKIDLAQAEAVQELICAKNHAALKAAEKQLQGSLSKKVSALQGRLTEVAAIIEAWIDYPEEGLEFASFEEIEQELEAIKAACIALQSTFRDGKLIKEGAGLCLIGAPNVGKSSLMNALLGKNRAIVTDIPGTTRDLLEEAMRIDDIHFYLVDTAGIRQTSEVIEQDGIRRSHMAAAEADLILLVLDVNRPLNSEEESLIANADPAHTLIVLNKIDLPHDLPNIPERFSQVPISAKREEGLSVLKSAIQRKLLQNRSHGEHDVTITQERHFLALSAAIEHLETVCSGFKNQNSPEFLTMDIKSALKELGKIIGSDVTEDILNAIFSKFCVGK